MSIGWLVTGCQGDRQGAFPWGVRKEVKNLLKGSREEGRGSSGWTPGRQGKKKRDTCDCRGRQEVFRAADGCQERRVFRAAGEDGREQREDLKWTSMLSIVRIGK